MTGAWQPLAGLLVVDLTRHLPGPFASRELLRHGARVVRLERPGGDPMRQMAPGWYQALNAGKESVICDLKADPAFGKALCSRADVLLEGFRPGVLERLGLGQADLPDTLIYCSISGFGQEGRHAQRAGHDLNYLGWAGLLAETAPVLPPIPIADLASGALAAVNQILLALYARTVTGRGRRLDVSMTHGAHHLAAYRLAGAEPARLLTGGFACYHVYATADARYLTLAALETEFFQRVCELIGRPELAAPQFDAGAQEELMEILAGVFAAHTLDHWLELFDGEDVCVGPVNTLAEAAETFGEGHSSVPAPEPGQHTAQWRADLGTAALPSEM